MKNLLLAVMFAAAPAAAQEFAADMPALSGILAQSRALKAASASPAPAPASAPVAYDPREIRIESLLVRGTDGYETTGKAVCIYHKDLRIATINIGDSPIDKHEVMELLAALEISLETSRLRAVTLGRKVTIDHEAIARYNTTGFSNMNDLAELERFGSVVRIADEAAPSSR